LRELTPKPGYGYSRSHRAFEIASIFVFFGLLGCFGYNALDAVDGGADRWPLGVSMLGGYLFADFVSGLVHWAGDTVGDESTPFLGPNFVTPFRQHHVDPMAITHHDFIETNGNSSIVALPVLFALVCATPRHGGWLLWLEMVVASTAFFIFCTNQFHKWAHAARTPAVVRWAQHGGLILSPWHHARHHAAPHDRDYCITAGWLNPVLNRMRFFRACEAVVGRFRPHWLHIDERRRRIAGE
jgi:hypothetical protein